MEVNKIYEGNCLEILKQFPKECIDMCVTSPPYWALRDYGVDGQIGLEETFEEYIKNLCDIFDEVKRVLKKEGTCWVNIGDTYYGSGKGVGTDPETCKETYLLPKGWKRPSRKQYQDTGIPKHCLYCKKEIKGQTNRQFCNKTCLNKMGNDFRSQNRQLPDKCLSLIPFRFAIEMVNRGWILRNTIIWRKPNAMPCSVRDRFTVDFEYLFFFSKGKKYFFEQQFEPYEHPVNRWGGCYTDGTTEGSKYFDEDNNPQKLTTRPRNFRPNLNGRNKRTVWSITTRSFKDAHFAVYPEELIRVPIQAGCPEFVCSKCGKPKVKIYKKVGEMKVPPIGGIKHLENGNPTYSGNEKQNIYDEGEYKPSCKCNSEFIPGVVLDPFSGAGTTGVVAKKQKKNYVLIDINKEYIEIAERRISKITDIK